MFTIKHLGQSTVHLLAVRYYEICPHKAYPDRAAAWFQNPKVQYSVAKLKLSQFEAAALEKAFCAQVLKTAC